MERKMKKRKFTLIELALSMARNKAKTMSCVSNLKQMTFIFNSYMSDNNEWCSTVDHYTGGTWALVYNTQGYIQAPKIFKCPSEDAKVANEKCYEACKEDLLICIAYVENFKSKPYFCGAKWTISKAL